MALGMGYGYGSYGGFGAQYVPVAPGYGGQSNPLGIGQGGICKYMYQIGWSSGASVYYSCLKRTFISVHIINTPFAQNYTL